MMNKYRLNDICIVNTVWSYFLTSSGQQGLQRSLARTKFMTNWIQAPRSSSNLRGSRLQAPNILEIRSLARTKLNPCSKLGLWAARLAELASQNKTESRLQAQALGCKLQAQRLRATGSNFLQVVKSLKTYKSPLQRAISEWLYAAILSFLGLLLLLWRGSILAHPPE